VNRQQRIARIIRDAAFAVGVQGHGCESAIEIAVRDAGNLGTSKENVIGALCDFYYGGSLLTWDEIVRVLDADKQRRFKFLEAAADFYGGGN
jgi:hypothetical protein